MSGRKPTPDVLSNVLNRSGRSSHEEEGIAVRRHDVILPEINKKPFKLTSYIDNDLNDEVDIAVLSLKKRVGRVSKSMLVEAALRLCLADTEGSGLESELKERNRK